MGNRCPVQTPQNKAKSVNEGGRINRASALRRSLGLWRTPLPPHPLGSGSPCAVSLGLVPESPVAQQACMAESPPLAEGEGGARGCPKPGQLGQRGRVLSSQDPCSRAPRRNLLSWCPSRSLLWAVRNPDPAFGPGAHLNLAGVCKVWVEYKGPMSPQRGWRLSVLSASGSPLISLSHHSDRAGNSGNSHALQFAQAASAPELFAMSGFAVARFPAVASLTRQRVAGPRVIKLSDGQMCLPLGHGWRPTVSAVVIKPGKGHCTTTGCAGGNRSGRRSTCFERIR